MPQFGLGSSNSHWGYGGTGAYSPYLAGGALSSCAGPAAPQFGPPALSFPGAPPDQTVPPTQDFAPNTSEYDEKLSNIFYINNLFCS